MLPAFQRVIREAVRWGVDVQPVDNYETVYRDVFLPSGGYLPRRGYYRGPYAGFIHWPRRYVFWPMDQQKEPKEAHFLMHEIIHCLMPTNPEKTCEVKSPMLALEYEANRRLRLGWGQFFGCDLSRVKGCAHFDDWEDLPTQLRGKLLAESYSAAARAGLMHDGKPTYRMARKAA